MLVEQPKEAHNLTLHNLSNPISFPLATFLYKSKAPSKLKVFVWLVAHKKVNTGDVLQLRRLCKTLSSD